jgi:hypothetical protein
LLGSSSNGSGIFPAFGKFSTVGVECFQLLVNYPLWQWSFPNFWFSKALHCCLIVLQKHGWAKSN